jgi:DNA-binding FadR family transcriptional regulator
MSQPSFAGLKVVRPKRIYEQIAAQIEVMIRSGQIAAGAKLPGERELADQLGVSRPSIREALIALETAGFVEVRAGGGTYIRDADPAGRIISFTDGADLGPGPLEQFEARRAIEPACAELAARYATAEQVDALEECLVRMELAVNSGRNPAEEHRQFHTLLADASRNSILASAVRELWRLRRETMWDLLRVRVENTESWQKGLVLRRQLIGCLRDRDGPGARAAMEAHFVRLTGLYFGSGG